jgi:hypothetical protein
VRAGAPVEGQRKPGHEVLAMAMRDLFFKPSDRPLLHRFATWAAYQMKTEDGQPIVRPGTEPTRGQKAAGVFFLVLTMSIAIFFIRAFSAVS